MAITLKYIAGALKSPLASLGYLAGIDKEKQCEGIDSENEEYVEGSSDDDEQDIPQWQKLSGDQVRNKAGGYVWKVDDMVRLRRFLCLGSEGGTYYMGEKELGLENAKCIQSLIESGRGEEAVKEIVAFSVEGRAAKQDPIIFALAICARQNIDPKTKALCYAEMHKVLRIPTHLFQFIELCEKLSTGTGWGRAHRKAVSNWYLRFRSDPRKLAELVTKYKNRNGWSHKDVLRLAHPAADSEEVKAVIVYVVKGLKRAKEECLTDESNTKVHKLFIYFEAIESLKKMTDIEEILKVVKKHWLVREHIPTEFLNEIPVWKALLDHMPMTALIRNLGKMSSMGLIKEDAPETVQICKRLTKAEALRRARVHPFNILIALLTYKQGHGHKGSLNWPVNQAILEALNKAFYKSFKYVEPTNLRFCLAMDVSGSMTWSPVNGCDLLTPREASAALALVTARTEKHYEMVAFSSTIQPMQLTPDLDLAGVVNVIHRTPMGSTDCAQPMLWAMQNNKKFDVFIVYTDCETWCGRTHPAEALRQYRQQSGIWNAKLIVCAMTSNGFTLADPEDPGMLDMAGFDSAGPQVIRNFALSM